MNSDITKVKQSEIIQKLKHDLLYGIKILAKFKEQREIIRVWTKFEEIEFIIVATSSKNSEIDINYIELESQMLIKNFNITLSIIKIDNKEQYSVKISQNNSVTKLQVNDFLNKYLQSKPDIDLIKRKFSEYKYAENEYKWVTPEYFLDI